MKFPLFLQGKEKTITIVGMIDRTEGGDNNKQIKVDGKGYVDEYDQVWIYSASGKPKNPNEYPYFWIGDNNSLEFSDPDELTLSMFKLEKAADLSIGVIVNNTDENEVLYNEQAINDMNKGAAVYVPEIHEDDDFLKKLIKTAIIEKGIDISRLKYKMNEKYVLPNMKAALENKTKMSVQYFMIWCELMGLDYTVTIEDNGRDRIDPLKSPLSYVSRKDEVVKETT